MGKPDFCLCKNKDADQLCSYCTADQHLCFRYTDSTTPMFSKSKISVFCACKTWFVSDMLGNPEDQFSGVMAYMLCDISEEFTAH